MRCYMCQSQISVTQKYLVENGKVFCHKCMGEYEICEITNAELLQEFSKYVRIISERNMNDFETKRYIFVYNQIINRMGGRDGIGQRF